jgi:hypothetical protein
LVTINRSKATVRAALTRIIILILPQFYRPNLTLRMAIAPVYLDSELGISHVLGEKHGPWHRPAPAAALPTVITKSGKESFIAMNRSTATAAAAQ